MNWMNENLHTQNKNVALTWDACAHDLVSVIKHCSTVAPSAKLVSMSQKKYGSSLHSSVLNLIS